MWLHCPAVPGGHSPKLHRPWRGPYTVVKVLGKATYRIRSDSSPHKRLVVHSNRLKPYHGSQTTPETAPNTNGNSQDGRSDPAGDDELMIDVQVQLHNASDCIAPDSDKEEETEIGATTPSDSETFAELTISTSDSNMGADNIAPPPLRRSTRARKPPEWYGTVVSYCDEDDSDEF